MKIAALRTPEIKLISPAVAGDINWLRVSYRLSLLELEADE